MVMALAWCNQIIGNATTSRAIASDAVPIGVANLLVGSHCGWPPLVVAATGCETLAIVESIE